MLHNCGKKNTDIFLFLAALAALGVFLFLKCPYGFGNADEAFYITIPYRWIQGDALFWDEWHMSQTSSLLLVPLVRLYLRLNGSLEGIILAGRYVYTALQLLTTGILYAYLRRISKIGGFFASLLFCVYAPSGMMAVSYNSLGLQGLALALVLVNFGGTAAAVLGGLSFAAAVLCCPYLAAVYGIYAAVSLWNTTKKRLSMELFTLRRFLPVTAGIAAAAAVYLAAVLSRVSILQIVQMLPNILRDPEHTAALLDKWTLFLEEMIFRRARMPYVMGAWLVLWLIGFFCPSERLKGLGGAAAVGLFGIQMVYSVRYDNYINHLMYPISLLAFYAFAAHRTPQTRHLFWGLFFPGVLYMLCIHLGSNQGIYVIASASAVTLIGSVMILACVGRDVWITVQLRQWKAAVCVLAVCILLMQGGTELYFRWNQVFWEKSMNQEEKLLLTEGPEKGVFTSSELKNRYESHLDTLSVVDEAQTVLFLSQNTWLYLCGSWRSGAFSAWLCAVTEDTLGRLDTYYETHPEKIPDIIFAEPDCAALAEAWTADTYRIAARTPAGVYFVRVISASGD